MVTTVDGNARAGSRTPLDKEVVLFSEQGMWLSGTLTDISFGGALVRMDTQPVSVKMPLTLVMICPSEENDHDYYSLDVTVVRKDREAIGLSFSDYNTETLSCLRRIYHDALQ